MDWLLKMCGIPQDNTIEFSIPKQKVLNNVRSNFLQQAFTAEMKNIDDIMYHAILRGDENEGNADELHILEVSLVEPKYVRKIAEGIDQAIPYSKIIIFSSNEKYLCFDSLKFSPFSKPYFSKWVYKEELLADFDYSESIYFSGEKEPIIWNDILNKLFNLFGSAGYSYISLRHMIDLLKIREIKSGKELICDVLGNLVGFDRVEYYKDFPFVHLEYVNQIYSEGSFFYHDIEDHRFGVDREYELLLEQDFTTMDETFDLLHGFSNSDFSWRGRWANLLINDENDYLEDDEEKW